MDIHKNARLTPHSRAELVRRAGRRRPASRVIGVCRMQEPWRKERTTGLRCGPMRRSGVPGPGATTRDGREGEGVRCSGEEE